MPPLLRLIGIRSTRRALMAIPIIRLTNHPNTIPGANHAKNNTRTEQGVGSRSLRHSLQQTRLRGSRTLLVAEIYSAQRAHCAGARRTVHFGALDASHVA